MKKFITLIIAFIISASCVAQTQTINGNKNNTGIHTFQQPIVQKNLTESTTNTNAVTVDAQGNTATTPVSRFSPLAIKNGTTLFTNSTGNEAGNGSGATIYNSNLFGQGAGTAATGVNNVNFFGSSAGSFATSAYQANFFGPNAGYNATNAYNSNFFGPNVAFSAINANNSNFFGRSAGYSASAANNSNFFGQFAGYGAANASASNLFGFQVGYNPGGAGIGENNIIIGTNISLPATTANSINIGGVLFGTGAYSTLTGNPSTTPNSGGKIGIGIVPTTQQLEVANSIEANSFIKRGGTGTNVLLDDGTTTTVASLTTTPNLQQVTTQGNTTIDNLKLGNGTFSADDSQALINRNLTTGGGTTGFHALRDETFYDTNAIDGLRAYASFDAIPIMQGTANFNHLSTFQSRPNYSGTGTIDALRGFTHQATNNGVVDLHQALFIDDFLGTGSANQSVGVYIKPLIKGVSNFAIFTEGVTPSYFGGSVQSGGTFNGLNLRASALSGTYGQILSVDNDGAVLGNPNLTSINGILDFKSISEARVKASGTNLALEALYNIQFFTTSDAGSEKMRLNYAGNLELLKLPPTSVSTYDILTRNTSTGVVEKVASTTYQTALTNPITGTGTVGTLPIFTGTSVLGNSSISEVGGRVLMGATDNTVDKLQVNGSTLATSFKKSGDTDANILLAGGGVKALSELATKAITVRKISTATTLANSDNGTVILLTASCTVTLPNGLSNGFNCSFATQAGATLTYTLGGSVTLINNSGLVMPPLSSHTLVNTGVANEYLTVGL
jgi:hypothetical protein